MTVVWYVHIESIPDESVDAFYRQLPAAMQIQANRFRDFSDRKRYILGRMLVYDYLRQQGIYFEWERWKVSPNGKPYVEHEMAFNISHSYELVAVAFCETQVGLDIEYTGILEWNELLSFLHPEEKFYVLNANDSCLAFYEIWTRKEAYLKAIGTGLLTEPNTVSCLTDQPDEKTNWHITRLECPVDYIFSICTDGKMKIELTEIKQVDWINLLNDEKTHH